MYPFSSSYINIKTGVKEERAGLAQARENERDLEMHDTRNDGVKKRMGSLSTETLSMSGPFMSGKDRSALKMQPWEVSVLQPIMVVLPGRSLMLQRSFSQPQHTSHQLAMVHRS